MLEEIKGETFEEYFKTLKDDLYNNLALAGYDTANMSPSFIKVNDLMLLEMAKRFWAIKVKIDKIPEMIEAGIPALRGGGYQPNKSDLDDSNPPRNP